MQLKNIFIIKKIPYFQKLIFFILAKIIESIHLSLIYSDVDAPNKLTITTTPSTTTTIKSDKIKKL